MKTSRLALVGIVAATAIALSGCQSASAPDSSGGADSGADTSLSDVQDSGKLVVGTEGTYRPFTFHDASGDLTGYDVEIGRASCRERVSIAV